MKTIYLLQNEKKTTFLQKLIAQIFTCKNILEYHFRLVKLTLELSTNIDYFKNYLRMSLFTCKNVIKLRSFSQEVRVSI